MDTPAIKPEPKFAAEWAPFIPYADESACPEHLRAPLAVLKQRFGFLPNSMRLYMHNPGVLAAVLAMGRNIVANPEGTLDRVLKNKIGVICSATNGCVYCTTHQCDMLSRNGGSHEGWGVPLDEVRAQISGSEKAASDLERVCFDYARAASFDAAGVTDEMRTRMKLHLTPAQIMELAAVVGFWKFLNTVHDSLNLPVESSNLHHTGYLDAWAGKGQGGARGEGP